MQRRPVRTCCFIRKQIPATTGCLESKKNIYVKQTPIMRSPNTHTAAEVTAVLCLLRNFDSTVKNLSSKASWWPLPTWSIAATIFIEIVCPLIIVYSIFNSRLRVASQVSVAALLIFTIIVTMIYHPYKWKSTYMKNIPFFANLSLIGGLGLLYLMQ
jgi:peptidoglycan/LPS O-acetylase OafA/YrhL